MISWLRLAAFGVMFAAFGGNALYALDLHDVLGNNTGTRPVEPSQVMPPLPKPAPQTQNQPQQVQIPALPPSLPCKQEWIIGLWEMTHTFESPLGAETQAYNQNPIQYISFGKDSRLFRLNAGNKPMQPQIVYQQMTGHSNALLQFLLQDAGMLYFYKDGVATDTLVCYVVAETKPPYAAGNLLLLPPQGSIAGRLIKVYKKVWPPRQQPGQPRPPMGRPGR